MRRVALGTLLAIGVFAGPVRAQPGTAPRQSAVTKTTPGADSVLDAQTTAVSKTLRCPVCQGESIQDSPSELSAQMRGVVRERLRAGESPESVRAYFASKYGEWILLEPKMTGLNILLYALPVVLVIGGVTLVVLLVRKWSAPSAGPPPDAHQSIP